MASGNKIYRGDLLLITRVADVWQMATKFKTPFWAGGFHSGVLSVPSNKIARSEVPLNIYRILD